jgi:lysophospholipase L1-like esterase
MTLIFKAKQTIEFIGDSITDCGKSEKDFEPLGNGYVRDINHLLCAGYPELQLTVINKGISGDRVISLKSRWKSDVLAVNPNWLFIYIGVNDVWRFFEFDREEAVELPEFENTYRQLIKSTQENTRAQLRLISPFLGEKDPDDPFRKKLSRYQAVIDKLGKEFDLPVIHLQPAFDWAMLSKPPGYWTIDRVHPTEVGHMLIALTVLRACGFRLKKNNLMETITPSPEATYERAKRIANYWLWTISLQHRRIQSDEPEDENFIFRKCADFDLLIVALKRLRRAVKIATKVKTIKRELDNALNEFDNALPNLTKMRDVAEHIDEYAVDKGKINNISRKQLEVSILDGTTLEWLDDKLDADEALKASERLFEVLKENQQRV